MIRVSNLDGSHPTKAEEDMNAAIEAASKPNTKVVMFTRTGATGHGPVFQTDYDLSLDELDEIKQVQAAAKAAGNKFVLVTFGRSGYSFEGDWLDDTDALIAVLCRTGRRNGSGRNPDR